MASAKEDGMRARGKQLYVLAPCIGTVVNHKNKKMARHTEKVATPGLELQFNSIKICLLLYLIKVLF